MTRYNWSGVVTGALGALFVFSGSWWPLPGALLIVAGFFLTMAFGDDGELQSYIFVAAAVFFLALSDSPSPNSQWEPDGPDPTCVAGSCF